VQELALSVEKHSQLTADVRETIEQHDILTQSLANQKRENSLLLQQHESIAKRLAAQHAAEVLCHVIVFDRLSLSIIPAV
jgi:hypothetical protein